MPYFIQRHAELSLKINSRNWVILSQKGVVVIYEPYFITYTNSFLNHTLQQNHNCNKTLLHVKYEVLFHTSLHQWQLSLTACQARNNIPLFMSHCVMLLIPQCLLVQIFFCILSISPATLNTKEQCNASSQSSHWKSILDLILQTVVLLDFFPHT